MCNTFDNVNTPNNANINTDHYTLPPIADAIAAVQALQKRFAFFVAGASDVTGDNCYRTLMLLDKTNDHDYNTSWADEEANELREEVMVDISDWIESEIDPDKWEDADVDERSELWYDKAVELTEYWSEGIGSLNSLSELLWLWFVLGADTQVFVEVRDRTTGEAETVEQTLRAFANFDQAAIAATMGENTPFQRGQNIQIDQLEIVFWENLTFLKT